MKNNPLRLEPYYVKKPWGGDYLNHLTATENHPVGEMILASALDVFPVRAVDVHTSETMAFQDYWAHKAPEIWKHQTADAFPQEFPLLLKVLSTKDNLSIQVHPSDEDLKSMGIKGSGKMESWVILDAKEGSALYLGIRNNVDISRIEKLMEEEDALRHFYSYIPGKGDIFILTPGLVHGTKGEILFYEIQQPSDFTYRIYDFGRGRELHLEDSKKVIRKQNVRIQKNYDPLDEKYFKLKIEKSDSLVTPGKIFRVDKNFEVITYFGEDARIRFHSTEEGGREKIEPLSWGTSFFLWKGSTFSMEFPAENSGGREIKVKDSLLAFASV